MSRPRIQPVRAGVDLEKAPVLPRLIDDPVETLKALRLLAGHRHDVIVFHVQDATELDFSFQGPALFRDLETGEEMEIDPAALRDDYARQMKELCEFYRKGLAELSVDYHLPPTLTSGVNSDCHPAAGRELAKPE